MKLNFTAEEIERIHQHGGECCLAVAESVMRRSRLNFDDIEAINGYSESHRWGSDADRRYRKRAINKAILYVASHAIDFI